MVFEIQATTATHNIQNTASDIQCACWELGTKWLLLPHSSNASGRETLQ